MIVPQQEFHIDHILAYTIQAGDILTNEIKLTDPKYRNVFISHGPEIYTGPLKSAGYLLLNPEIDHLILIYIQDYQPEQVMIFEDKEGILALGKQFEIVDPKISGSIASNQIDSDILLQFNFLSIIKPILKISIIGVGSQVNQKDIITYIKKNQTDKKVGCIFYDTCSRHISRDDARSIDEIALSNIIEKKEGHIDRNSRLANMFIKTLNTRSKPRLLGYVNSGDFGGAQDQTTSYACMVG